MLRYLAPDMLEERKVNHFDSWASNFAESVTSPELSPDGAGYRMNTRFAKFINLPELLQMFRSVTDVQTADMLKCQHRNVYQDVRSKLLKGSIPEKEIAFIHDAPPAIV